MPRQIAQVSRMAICVHDLVRHEAPCDRVEMKGLHRWPVAAGHGSWGQPESGSAGEGESSPDNAGTGRYCQTARVRRARREGVTRVNQWLKPLNARPGSNLVDVGRLQCTTALGWSTPKPFQIVGGEAMGKDCGVPVAMLQGQSWAPHSSTGSW